MAFLALLYVMLSIASVSFAIGEGEKSSVGPYLLAAALSVGLVLAVLVLL